jgi:hypothetical protein
MQAGPAMSVIEPLSLGKPAATSSTMEHSLKPEYETAVSSRFWRAFTVEHGIPPETAR